MNMQSSMNIDNDTGTGSDVLLAQKNSLQPNSSNNNNVTATIISQNDTSLQCVICLEDIRSKAIVSPCFHKFCQFCIFQWINVKLFCPVCRQNICKVMFNIESDSIYEEFDVSQVSPPAPSRSPQPVNNDSLYQNPVVFRAVLQNVKEYFENALNTTSMQTVKFTHFVKAIHSSCSVPLTYRIFRSFVYYYNLHVFKDKKSSTRYCNLDFFRDNPATLHRLLDFVKFDIESLKNLYEYDVSPIFLSHVHQLLLNCDINSKAFPKKLKLLVQANSTLITIEFDIVNKLYEELLCFGKSPFATVHDYIRSVIYELSFENTSVNTVNNHMPVNSTNPDEGKRQKNIEVIVINSSESDSDIQLVNDAHGAKRNQCEEPVAGPSGLNSTKRHCATRQEHAHSSNIATKNAKRMSGNHRPKRLTLTSYYTRRDVLEMRRTIRNAKESEYFFRRLLREIKKKFYHFDTILNTEHFSHLNDYFKDLLCCNKLYRNKVLNNQTTKETLTIEQIQKRLNQPSTSGVGQSGEYHSSSEDSDQLSDSDIILENYETTNWNELNKEVIKHALSPPKSNTNRFLLARQIEKIQFQNRIYSDTD